MLLFCNKYWDNIVIVVSNIPKEYSTAENSYYLTEENLDYILSYLILLQSCYLQIDMYI